jgi:hypothetical protein
VSGNGGMKGREVLSKELVRDDNKVRMWGLIYNLKAYSQAVLVSF